MMSVSEKMPKQILSGALHYFRVHPGLWDDRLAKAVAMGLNTIETYIPWNLHEPHRGEFVFDGICDLETFLRKAAGHGLFVIVRPGPYICAEWDNGGFPGWLLNVPGVELRRRNRPYLDAVTDYFKVLLPKLVPFQITSGGPLLMMQIENEYGSFGNDHDYLRFLQDLYRESGIDVPCFTSDGPYGHYPVGGALEGALLTVNFGTRSREAFQSARKLRPEEPDFCMEFWDGWFDHWGEKHQHRPAADGGDSFAAEYESMVSHGAHVNLYMFHGGTNFGFTAGANGNFREDYAPVVTSYDYDCPLSECGDPTEKFLECQRILKKYTGNPKIQPVPPAPKIVPPPVRLTGQCRFREHPEIFSRKHGKSVTPPTLEALGENFGFVYYKTRIDPFEGKAVLRLFEVNDYAQVWLDGRYLGHRFRDSGKDGFCLEGRPEGSLLEILTENMGRINYGPYVGRDPKGIAGAVCLDFQQLFHWEYDLVPLASVDSIPFTDLTDRTDPASFYSGTFELEETGEAFLMRPGRKGCVWINGFPLGRYWEAGPTETLYVPSAILKKGVNHMILFEQEGLLSEDLCFSPQPRLGELEQGRKQESKE